jgi:hypothetical protein
MRVALQHKTMAESLPQYGPVVNSILKTLAYFDIFQYPLSKEDIRQFLDQPASEHALQSVLDQLVAEQTIFCYHQFYSLHDNPLPACKRIRSNQRAESMLPRANRVGRFLYHFPFVRAVGISGSLSKNVADEKADFDFFIITKANRLWIARTLMHIFKKLTYLTGRQHHYCMNYYIDEEALQLDDRNIFTAMEIKTLVPVSGSAAMTQFFTANTWTDEWLPACTARQQARPDPQRMSVKHAAEWLLNVAGNSIDNFLMSITRRRWQHKHEMGKRNEKGQRMDLITGKHFARSNPGAFQEKVLSAYAHKLDELNVPGV